MVSRRAGPCRGPACSMGPPSLLPVIPKPRVQRAQGAAWPWLMHGLGGRGLEAGWR